jgi:hypothetical protein
MLSWLSRLSVWSLFYLALFPLAAMKISEQTKFRAVLNSCGLSGILSLLMNLNRTTSTVFSDILEWQQQNNVKTEIMNAVTHDIIRRRAVLQMLLHRLMHSSWIKSFQKPLARESFVKLWEIATQITWPQYCILTRNTCMQLPLANIFQTLN